VSAKFEFIDAQKADFPIVKMCEWAQVSTSGYYEWRNRPASATVIRRAHLAVLIKAVFEHSDQTYGYRRVHAQLVGQGQQVSPELVQELMRELGLVACQPRPYRPTTTSPGDPGPIRDLVNRDFTAQAPGQKWWAISPTFRPGRVGCISPRSSTATPKPASDTPWPTISAPN
jgi:putative transposase